MFTPNLDTYTSDDAIIETFTRENSARASRANASKADKMTFDRKKAEWKRHPAIVRSTLSEIFLWFIREVSTSEIQQDFEQVFRSHILQNQAASTIQANPFNGDILINHIESNHVSDDSDSITAMERKFELWSAGGPKQLSNESIVLKRQLQNLKLPGTAWPLTQKTN